MNPKSKIEAVAQWPQMHGQDGVAETRLGSWTQFNDVVHKLLDHPDYAFRGHRRSGWLLEPTLARLLKAGANIDESVKRHLDSFRYSIRGRRGPNPAELDENGLWALGQHNGLATPLLDWTMSPYVALFFAFAQPAEDGDDSYRVVFALNESRVTGKSNLLLDEYEKSGGDFLSDGPPPTIGFLRPLSDENSRLVNQAGLFTKSPASIDIECWVRKNFAKFDKVVLFKVFIHDDDRTGCLKALNKMNISHSTLFPDLYGASEYANLKLQIPNY